MTDKKFNYTARLAYICPCCDCEIGDAKPDYCPTCEVRMTYPDCPEVTVEEIASIIDCHLQPLDITGLEAEEINELEMWHDLLVDTIAQSIHRLYGGETKMKGE